jgi:peptidoglycan/xylan/chitin deacetylase (PgdA/CDA1 family)
MAAILALLLGTFITSLVLLTHHVSKASSLIRLTPTHQVHPILRSAPASTPSHTFLHRAAILQAPPPTVGLQASVTFCPILMYHYIRINPNPYDILGQHLSVTPQEFEAEMRFLHDQHFATITLDQLADHIRYGTPIPQRSVVLTFDDGYADHYWKVLPILERFGLKATFFIVTNFVGRPGYMNWQQIRALSAAGMEIGDHTLDHQDLTILSPQRDWQEIYESKLILERQLRQPIEVFAYPSGAVNERVLAAVQRAGYVAAVSTLPGTLHSRRTLYYLYRVRILDTDTPQTLEEYLIAHYGNPFGPPPTPSP